MRTAATETATTETPMTVHFFHVAHPSRSALSPMALASTESRVSAPVAAETAMGRPEPGTGVMSAFGSAGTW